MTRANGMLRRCSGGRGPLAALILVLVYLAPLALAIGFWSLGQASVFDDRRWIPVALVALGIPAGLVVLWVFGMTGIPGAGAYGERYAAGFTRGWAIVLDLIRWVLQLVLFGGTIAMLILAVSNTRWWEIVGTPQTRGLAQRAALMPIPSDMVLDYSYETNGDESYPSRFWHGELQGADEITLDRVAEWLQSPDWASSFGALRFEGCIKADGSCSAYVVPAAGHDPEYFLEVDLRPAMHPGWGTDISIVLHYAQEVSSRG